MNWLKKHKRCRAAVGDTSCRHRYHGISFQCLTIIIPGYREERFLPMKKRVVSMDVDQYKELREEEKNTMKSLRKPVFSGVWIKNKQSSIIRH